VSTQVQKFMLFVREQGVVGLAVGLAIGTQVTIVVNQIVNSFINPLVGFVLSFIPGLGSGSLESYKWVISSGDHPLTIAWGAILSGLITLLAVAAIIFYVVKGLKLDKLDKKADK
jgi:large-conductance mechanosensitive channel